MAFLMSHGSSRLEKMVEKMLVIQIKLKMCGFQMLHNEAYKKIDKKFRDLKEKI